MPQTHVEAPLRVVVFSSGPVLTRDAREFLLRLDLDPTIQFCGAVSQAASTSLGGVFRDLFRRRGQLAFPLFLAFLSKEIAAFLRHPLLETRARLRIRRLDKLLDFVPDIHAPSVLEKVSKLKADLGLVYGAPILRAELFEIPRLGTLGIHHGKVPEYRGNKTTFWAIYEGNESVGVTIQKIRQGLDTGDVVSEASVPVGRRCLSSVRLELEEIGLDVYLQAIKEYASGTATARAQPADGKRPYKNPKLKHLIKFQVLQFRRLVGIPVARKRGTDMSLVRPSDSP